MNINDKADFNEWAINLQEQIEIFRYGRPLRLTKLAKRKYKKEKEKQFQPK